VRKVTDGEGCAERPDSLTVNRSSLSSYPPRRTQIRVAQPWRITLLRYTLFEWTYDGFTLDYFQRWKKKLKFREMNSTFVRILLAGSLFCLSCDKDEIKAKFDKDGIAIRLPHLWKASTTDDGKLSETVIATPIIHDGTVLVGSRKSGERAILCLNATDGSTNWQWNDVMNLLTVPGKKDPITLYAESYHVNNGRLFFTYTGSSYCLDLNTGNTIWKYKLVRGRFDRNAGLEDKYFTSGSTYDPIDDEKIYTGSVNSAEEEELLLVPDYTPQDNPPANAQGRITHMTPFAENGMDYLAFGIENPYADFSDAGWGLTELNLYNLTEAGYEYSKVVVNPSRETRVIYDLIYSEQALYFQSTNFIHKYNALTGEELWRRRIGTPPAFSSMIMESNRLFSANEDRNLYCIDAGTGQIEWREPNTGTCSELSYLNGVLYYLGGGDGLLHAVDATTGKHLWRIQSPEFQNNEGFFHGVCIAVPGDNGDLGIVIATTGRNAYAYRAIK
jgi:outer membrane protein assembly factor BamB